MLALHGRVRAFVHAAALVCMKLKAYNWLTINHHRLLFSQKRFHLPPATPPAGTWPPPGWAPSAALQERDRRRAARKKRGLPEIDPQDDLEQQQLTDLRPAAGAPWGSAGGAALPPQWRELPGGAPQEAYLGDVEQDVSISYRYG